MRSVWILYDLYYILFAHEWYIVQCNIFHDYIGYKSARPKDCRESNSANQQSECDELTDTRRYPPGSIHAGRSVTSRTQHLRTTPRCASMPCAVREVEGDLEAAELRRVLLCLQFTRSVC